MTIRIAIIGANGRMGQKIAQLCEQNELFRVVALIDPQINTMLPDLSSAPEFDVAVDFSSPQAALLNVPLAEARKSAYLLATTGLTQECVDSITAHKNLPLLIASNTSLGVALMQRLCTLATQTLPNWDCEILESHHRNKIDAPSGTALSLAKTIQEAQVTKGKAITQRTDLRAVRAQHDIGIASLRGGTIAGEHTVMWLGPNERVEIRHVAEDRTIFAHGALSAAAWLVTQAPGLYSMQDVLG